MMLISKYIHRCRIGRSRYLFVAALATVALCIHYCNADETDLAVKSLEGNWIPENFESGGINLMFRNVKNPPFPGLIEFKTLEIKGCNATLNTRLFGKEIPIEYKFKIDLSIRPKRFEVTINKNRILHGIYALDDNILVLSVQTCVNGKPPNCFNSHSSDSVVVVILRKQDGGKRMKEKGKGLEK